MNLLFEMDSFWLALQGNQSDVSLLMSSTVSIDDALPHRNHEITKYGFVPIIDYRCELAFATIWYSASNGDIYIWVLHCPFLNKVNLKVLVFFNSRLIS